MKQKAVSGIMPALLLIAMLFFAFSIQDVKAGGSWIWVMDTTISGAWGEAVVGTGTALYIARGTAFYRYRPSDNSWVNLTNPPKPDGTAFKTGTALAWDFGDCIYALYGANSTDNRRWFYRYSISQDSWEALANTTADQGEGDAITWVGIDNCIYATVGGETERPTCFMRYDPSANTWSDALANPPAGMGDGASLVWTGGNYLYALRGEFYETSPLCDFWRYSLVDNSWATMTDIPATAHDGGSGGVGDGGSLLYIGFWLSNQTDYIYALSGNQAVPDSIPDNRFYRYVISANSWKRLADLPFGVGHYVGCRLGYANGYIYAWQGAPDDWAGEGDDLARYEFPPLSPPVADFDYSPTSPSVNETVTFDASSSYDLDGTIMNYTWNFGDDTVVTVINPIITHAYEGAGSYTVNLTVTDNDGLVDTATKSVSVEKLSSIITINVYPTVATVCSNITVNGTIIPIRCDVNVTISHRPFGYSTWNTLATVKTDSNSNYTYIWKTSEIGTYDVKASWQGDANTLSAESQTKTVTINPIDSTPPTTTHDYDDLWHCKNFTINLTAVDDLSGVAETYYRINEGSIENVSANAQPYITTENANNTLEYWSIDNAGIEELPHKILTGIKLDKTYPIIETPSRMPDGDVSPDQSVKVSVNATDATSEIKNVTLSYIINDGTTWTDSPMNYNWSNNLYEAIILGQPAETLVKYKIVAFDHAGNNATKDGTEPYCTYQVIPEFSSTLPLFMALFLTTVLFAKRKLHKLTANRLEK